MTQENQTPAGAEGCYELRQYLMVPGRLPDLHHFMNCEVPPIFERCGVPRPLAYWDGLAGAINPCYSYLVRWDSADQRMRAWAALYGDPEFVRARRIDNDPRRTVDRLNIYLMRPSAAWPRVMTPGADTVGGVHEMRLYQVHGVSTRAARQAEDTLADAVLPREVERGATVLGMFTMWHGPSVPQIVVLLAWPDLSTRRAGLAHAASAAGGAPRAWDACTVSLLRPAEYGVARRNFAPLEDGPGDAAWSANN